MVLKSDYTFFHAKTPRSKGAKKTLRLKNFAPLREKNNNSK